MTKMNMVLCFALVMTFLVLGNFGKVMASNYLESKVLFELNDWTQINEKVYVSTGSYVKVNMVLVVDQGKATLIDLGYQQPEGQRVKDFLEQNHLELVNIIVTHLHGDHTGNFSMFKPTGEVYQPSLTQDGQIIEMAGSTMKFKVLKTPGHAANVHDSIELVDERILVAGDVVVGNWVPVIGFGGSYHELVDTLHRIRKNNYKIIIPGHGDILESNAAITNQLHYLTTVYHEIDKITAGAQRPLTKEQLYTMLYDQIRVEDAVKDTTVLDLNDQDKYHTAAINKILDVIIMEAFLTGEVKTPSKK